MTYDKFYADAHILADQIKASDGVYTNIFGIPRGGVPLAIVLSSLLDIPLLDKPEDIDFGTLLVDDLIDGGTTIDRYLKNTKSAGKVAVLYIKPHSPYPTYYVDTVEGWIEFPYEQTNADDQSLIVRLLETLGEDPTREGLLETPKRVLKFYREFLSPPEFNFTTFDSEGYDEMIVQKNIPFFSLCEHHMAPFFGTATVAYIPDKKIVGLSKLARTVDLYSRKLQNQERITTQVAAKLNEELSPGGVAVILQARHFCMEMRGIKTHDVFTTTSKLTGAFLNNAETRQELMAFLA